MISAHRTILLTGCSGFIAKHVALELIRAGYGVRGTVRDLARGDEVKAALAAHHDPAEVDAMVTFVEADLTDDAGWDAAVAGVEAVIHTASPFPVTEPKDESALIRPAVDGTLRVLGAAKQAGVERVVLTSSVAAVTGGQPGVRAFDANNWTITTSPQVSAYAKSKTLAEQAAWDFAKSAGLALTTINPSLVVGPLLDDKAGTSLDLVSMLLEGKFPMLPKVQIGVVDVRDVARLHVLALSDPGLAGRRIIASERSLWFSEIAKTLKRAFPAYPVRTAEAPSLLVRAIAIFDSRVRQIAGDLGHDRKIDGTPAAALLGRYVAADAAILAAAESLLAHGLVKRR